MILILGDAKPHERIQSVLVTACTSNGPMLSHTTPRYRKVDPERTNNNDIPNKEQFIHNGEKVICLFPYELAIAKCCGCPMESMISSRLFGS